MTDERPRNDEDEREWIDPEIVDDDDDEVDGDDTGPMPLEASPSDVLDQQRAVPLEGDEHDR